MKVDVHAYVIACIILQQANTDILKLYGMLRWLEALDRSSVVVSLVFVEGLPMWGDFKGMLVVFDLFSKYCHFA